MGPAPPLNEFAESLRRHHALSLLPLVELSETVQQSTRCTLAIGDTLFAAGDLDDSAYFLLRGRLRIVHLCGSHRSSLATVRPGALMGAHSVADHWQRNVTCYAAEESEVAIFPRATLEGLFRRRPDLAPHFDKSLEDQLLLEILGLDQLLSGVPAEQIFPAIDSFGEASFAAGETVVREGDRGDTMYVVVSGRLEVRKWLAARQQRVAELSKGDYFGECSLVLEAPRSATVSALEPTVCFTLKHEDLKQLQNTAPTLACQLRGRFHAYSINWAAINDSHQIVLAPVLREQIVHRDASELPSELPAIVEQPMLWKMLRLSRLMDLLPPMLAAPVFNRLQETVVQAGDKLVEQGLVIVRTGELTVRSRLSQADAGELCRLGPGDLWGAGRLLGKADDCRLTAVRRSECFTLEPTASQLLSQHLPPWRSLLEKLAAEEFIRQLPEESLPNESPVRELASCAAVHSSRGGRFPWIAARRDNECGVASLAMLLQYLGQKVPYEQVREAVDLLPHGCSLFSLQRAAESFGLQTRPVRFARRRIPPDALPAIIHWDDSHYQVLYQVQGRRAIYADPAVGLVRTSLLFFKRRWNGRLLKINLN
ncbi:Lactococcin-G-processing and transport ATP-binding protein LagD [Lignipirellula cremea]|uniref:Lactococcin-G-processing and transport ATP-binding protein LagD n=2 Tax=Lignipirellula cremea TaxID=2528010 RepID=A0A518DRS0_9BACT|nr:Lactococcin-G-processing and transport ATP-binding protein LagD [Lignipirellula cremea]